jgi:hypothetical protein
MNQQLDNLHPGSGLSATARIIIMYLSDLPGGARVEEIATNTCSRYRWIETTVLRLHHDGLLCRVGPNAYALNPDRAPAVQQ